MTVCYCLYQANAGRHQLQNCLKLAKVHSLVDEAKYLDMTVIFMRGMWSCLEALQQLRLLQPTFRPPLMRWEMGYLELKSWHGSPPPRWQIRFEWREGPLSVMLCPPSARGWAGFVWVTHSSRFVSLWGTNTSKSLQPLLLVKENSYFNGVGILVEGFFIEHTKRDMRIKYNKWLSLTKFPNMIFMPTKHLWSLLSEILLA